MIRGAIEGPGLRRKIVLGKIDAWMEENKMKTKSWRTSLGGVGMILAGLSGLVALITKVVNEGTAAINEQSISAATLAFGSISGGVALIFARDNRVSSEMAGAGNVPPITSPSGDIKP